MARPCSICAGPSDKRKQIDDAIVRRESFRGTARSNAVSEDAVGRHRAHVIDRLRKADQERAREQARATREAEAQERRDGNRLLAKLEALEARADRLLAAAEAKGQLGPAAGLLRELRELLKLFGEISGELKSGTAVTVNLFQLPEWGDVQRRLLSALSAFPEARIAAARALLPPGGNGEGGPDA